MATLNNSHHQDGGVLLYSGELVLLYCDKVHCDIDNVGSATGRMFLTTHRIVFTAKPINQNSKLQSLAAPFYAMFDLGLEQPVFGSNYIRGKVRTNSNDNTSALTQNQFSFKLKFNKGGAIEYGKALTIAAKQASQVAAQTGFSNNYNFSTSAAGQYYAAPSNIYQPNYPVGFVLPNEVFSEVPQQGTIYYQAAPPPYPGLTPAHQQAPTQSFAPQPVQGLYAQVYPTPVNTVFENSAYTQVYPPPSANLPTVHYPSVPQQQQGGYMPGSNNPPSYQGNYPPQQNSSYPQQAPPGYEPQSQQNSIYPQTPQQQSGGYVPQGSNTTYPNIPSYDQAVKKEK